MSEIESDALEAFVAHVVGLLAKNGFPERKVAFPIERMYDSAHAKGVNFNKVLDALAARGICHDKTPEKVIFSDAAPALAMPDMGPFSGLDPAAFEGMSHEQLFAAAAAAMQQMPKEQLAAMRAMVEGMTPEQQAAMLEQARKLGIG
jgi:hypothetical protein